MTYPIIFQHYADGGFLGETPLSVTFLHVDALTGDREQPDEPESVEILSVKWMGIEIMPFITESGMKGIEEAALEYGIGD